MVEFKSKEDIEEFFRGRPREEAVAFAARAALRALPALWTAQNWIGEGWALSLILPVFYATVAPWSAAKYPGQGAELTARAAGNASSRATARASSRAFAQARERAAAAADAATCASEAAAAYAADIAAVRAADIAAGRAADAAYAASTAAATYAANAADATDATLLAEDTSAQALLGHPLWHEKGAPPELLEMWEEMKAALLDLDPNWEVWTEWYEDRLQGAETSADYEIARVLIDPKLLEEGPEAVNSELLRLRDLRDEGKLPPAKETAERYRAEFMQDVATKDEQDAGPLEDRVAAIQAQLDALEPEAAQTLSTELTELRKDLTAAQSRVTKQTKALSDFEAAFENQNTEIKTYREQIDEVKEALSAAQKSGREEHAAIIQGLRDARDDLVKELLGAAEIKAPGVLWAEKEREHKRRQETAFYLFISGLILIGYTVLWSFKELLVEESIFTEIFAPAKDENGANIAGLAPKGVLFTIGTLTLATITLWFTRLQMKIFLAERHLALDARERLAFAQTYMAMLEGDKLRETTLERLSEDAREELLKDAQAQKQLVYAALFRPTQDGIVKEDSGFDPSMSAAISKFLAGK